jgi:hypothetical protein
MSIGCGQTAWLGRDRLGIMILQEGSTMYVPTVGVIDVTKADNGKSPSDRTSV